MKLSLRVISYQGSAPDQPLAITVSHEGATIGRRQDNTLVLPDEKRYISGHHAKIEYRAPDYYLTDISTNGVLINDSAAPLGKGNSIKLNDGDRLHIGDYTLAVELVPARESHIPAMEPLDLPPVGPLADQHFDFPDDPFADLGEAHKDVIKEVIEKNALIPEEWQKSGGEEPGPFDFPDQDISAPETGPEPEEEQPQRSDFEHIPDYKEAFQPFQEQKEAQPPEEEPERPELPEDFFAEDWSFLEEQETGKPEPPPEEIPPPEAPQPVETVQPPAREPPPPPPAAKAEAARPAERPPWLPGRTGRQFSSRRGTRGRQHRPGNHAGDLLPDRQNPPGLHTGHHGCAAQPGQDQE